MWTVGPLRNGSTDLAVSLGLTIGRHLTGATTARRATATARHAGWHHVPGAWWRQWWFRSTGSTNRRRRNPRDWRSGHRLLDCPNDRRHTDRLHRDREPRCSHVRHHHDRDHVHRDRSHRRHELHVQRRRLEHLGRFAQCPSYLGQRSHTHHIEKVDQRDVLLGCAAGETCKRVARR